MQEIDNLDLCIKFILYNSENNKLFSQRFSIDSRRINKGQVFVSLHPDIKKNKLNIKDALRNGATGFITPFKIFRKDIKVLTPYLIIENINKLSISLLKNDLTKLRHQPVLIGITGTNGKTSTSLLLAQALSYHGKKVGLICSEGNGIYPDLKTSGYTTPPIDINYRLIFKYTQKKCDYIIIESSSQGIDQGRIEGIKFTYAIITNIDQDHLEYHKSLKNYVNTKLSILHQSKTAIVNYDSVHLKKITQSKYSLKNLYFISQKKISNKKGLNINSPLYENKYNSFNHYSIKMISAVMWLEKFKKPLILRSIDNLTPLKGRRQIINTSKKGSFIIDYAHTVDAYKNIYKDFASNKKITTLFGCGGDRDKSKRMTTAKVVDNHSTHVIITKDNSRTEKFEIICRDILKGIKNKIKVVIIPSRKKAIHFLLKTSSANQINFILGKGNEDFILENNKKIKHNDIIYLNKIIRKYGY